MVPLRLIAELVAMTWPEALVESRAFGRPRKRLVVEAVDAKSSFDAERFVVEAFPKIFLPVKVLVSERSDEDAAKTEMLEEPLKGTPLMVRMVARTLAAVVVPRICWVKELDPVMVLFWLRKYEALVVENPSPRDAKYEAEVVENALPVLSAKKAEAEVVEKRSVTPFQYVMEVVENAKPWLAPRKYEAEVVEKEFPAVTNPMSLTNCERARVEDALTVPLELASRNPAPVPRVRLVVEAVPK